MNLPPRPSLSEAVIRAAAGAGAEAEGEQVNKLNIEPLTQVLPKVPSQVRTHSSSKTKKAATQIQRFLTTATNKSKKTKKAATQIQRFLTTSHKHNISQKVGRMLNAVCASSGFCLAIGSKEVSIVNHYFKEFRTFEFLRDIQRIGIESQNGFVNLLHYQRNRYNAYAVKIIDYGECYVSDGPQNNSNEIAKKLCDERANPDCNEWISCGWGKGFKKFSKTSASRRFSNIRNISHDLRFANLCSKFFVPASIHGYAVDELLKKVVYGMGIMNKDKTMGTIEQSSGYPEKIKSVMDMARSLEDLIQSEPLSRVNTEKYAQKRNMGTLTMYCNGTETPMKWKPN